MVPAEEALRARLSGPSPVEAVRAAIDLLGGKTSDVTVKTYKPAALAGLESSLECLVVQAALYPDLASFIDDLAQGSPQDGYEAHGECVSLMTMHAAKGLEFDYVFVADLEERLLPFMPFGERGTEGGSKKEQKNGDRG